jgi:hypothetical protein
MLKTLGAGALVLLATVATESRADSYDGKWMVPIPGVSTRCPAVNAHINVAGQKISETAGTAKFTFHLFGTLASDGSFELKSPGGQGHSKGKFSGNSVTADFTDSECPTRTGTGGREP